jgi:uncharacterized protein (TIGR02246 family)
MSQGESMHRRAIFAIAGAALLASCKPAQFDPQDPVAIAAIDSIVQSMMAGSRDVNAAQVLSAAAPDVTFITGDIMLSGLETLQARFDETYAGLTRQDQTLIDHRIRLVSPDVAVVTAIAEGTYTDKAGWTSDTVGIGTTLVFVREGGQWRVRHAHQSIAY